MNQTKTILVKLSFALLAALAMTGGAVATAAPELPDGRVYELVTSNTDTPTSVFFGYGLRNNVFQWQVLQPSEPATSGTGNVFRADRTDQGWKVSSRETPPAPRNTSSYSGQAFNRNMSAYYWYAFAPGEEVNGQAARMDIWGRVGDGPAERIPLPHGTVGGGDMTVYNFIWAVSDDGQRVGINTYAALVSQDTNNGLDLYVVDRSGNATLVSAKPDGTPIDSCITDTEDIVAGGVTPYRSDTFFTPDLKTVFFAGGGCGQPVHIYARLNLSTTVDASPSKASSPPLLSGAREELGASSDGSEVLFETDESLLDTDTNGHRDIYAYDLKSDHLTWISKGNGPGDDLQLQGFVTADLDLDHIYFVGTGTTGASGAPGAPNLFVWHNGAVRLVTTLSYDGVQPWQSTPANGASMNGNAGVTPDGNRLAFLTSTAIAEDDADSAADIYGYDFASGVMRKLSAGDAEIDVMVPFLPANGLGPIPVISDDGQYGVFQTAEGIDQHDNNDDQDVYRWLWSDGSSALISAGIGRPPTQSGGPIEGISPDGMDVFFRSYERLAPSDTDNSIDVYSARIGGRKEPGPGTAPCEGDACQGDYEAKPWGGVSAAGGRERASGNSDAVVRGEVTVARLSAAALKRASASGKVTVTVRVNRRGSVAASLVERMSKRAVSRGQVTRSVSEAGKVTLSVPVSVAGRARLRKTGHLKLTLRVVFSAGLEPQEQTITLRKAAGAKGRS